MALTLKGRWGFLRLFISVTAAPTSTGHSSLPVVFLFCLTYVCSWFIPSGETIKVHSRILNKQLRTWITAPPVAAAASASWSFDWSKRPACKKACLLQLVQIYKHAPSPGSSFRCLTPPPPRTPRNHLEVQLLPH